MSLKKEVQIKIDGRYVKGSVIAGKFRTNSLVNIELQEYHYGISGDMIRRVIDELQELANIVDAGEVTEELAREDTNGDLDNNWDSLF